MSTVNAAEEVMLDEILDGMKVVSAKPWSVEKELLTPENFAGI